MKLIELFKTKKPVISFEIFPPKLDMPIESIYNKLSDFKALKPDFMSVTYGAGGSAKDRTIEIATKIKKDYNIESMAHFTCVGHSKEEIDALLDSLKKHGLDNVLALRGDPPANQPDFDFSKNVYQYASELIEHIKKKNDLCIAAAAYAEGHIGSCRIKDDLINLKHKVDKGVDFLVTQLFFDNRIFYDFLDRALALGITCPVTTGIMPVFKADQIKKLASLCGTSIPAKLLIMMDKYGDNPDDMLKAGIEYASNQIQDLIDNGVDGIHLLTMNRAKSTKRILQNLNMPQN
ncbi:methylenetetrahydrofolate reductase [NAD(P)H] [Herbivorax sp. ANBcel31]|uniref:methylenetetrahydrofolate reductase [NAD(P)H] n=1 Tax=Herbivorax sp. ANBcel31 TaxID=3069754 RepID=UPI0027B154E8|nr:methylenetetrahydrofolate reductase [NAD(P)H] [Herbivorax sp. ANBcel31]MDQ2085728.1 methylenetetrahydrofolate reductase [NAD(P)H] [Herbivorax sp. ANBcel31]